MFLERKRKIAEHAHGPISRWSESKKLQLIRNEIADLHRMPEYRRRVKHRTAPEAPGKARDRRLTDSQRRVSLEHDGTLIV